MLGILAELVHSAKILYQQNMLDIYDGIQSEILSTTRFDENSDLSTTYIGRVDMTRTSNIKVEEMFPISEQGGIQ